MKRTFCKNTKYLFTLCCVCGCGLASNRNGTIWLARRKVMFNSAGDRRCITWDGGKRFFMPFFVRVHSSLLGLYVSSFVLLICVSPSYVCVCVGSTWTIVKFTTVFCFVVVSQSTIVKWYLDDCNVRKICYYFYQFFGVYVSSRSENVCCDFTIHRRPLSNTVNTVNGVIIENWFIELVGLVYLHLPHLWSVERSVTFLALRLHHSTQYGTNRHKRIE